MALTLRSLLVLALASSLLAQGLPPDPRVEEPLKKLEWSYKTDEDGDYQLVMQTEGERTQLLVVRSKTFTVGKLEMREIWSAAGIYDGEIPAEVARALLDDSLQTKLGSWAILPQSEGTKQLVLYVSRIPADADLETFSAFAEGVAQEADSFEMELTGKDDY
jgi:thiamine monophosphate kinase